MPAHTQERSAHRKLAGIRGGIGIRSESQVPSQRPAGRASGRVNTRPALHARRAAPRPLELPHPWYKCVMQIKSTSNGRRKPFRVAFAFELIACYTYGISHGSITSVRAAPNTPAFVVATATCDHRRAHRVRTAYACAVAGSRRVVLEADRVGRERGRSAG